MDWFREKHNIRIVDSIHKSCMSGTLEKLYKFNIIKIDGLYTKDLLFGTSTENQYYDSYYNALNKAFEEAFKLI